ncbi:hypothetical protein PR202_gb20719 [Eleusine coracana subsp. coracana]|uniref:Uncharacterized protein n=1 Tax=Eleusine coracana subsp. coracana TaxID=191504 RepID=A0AAV5F977_ELECO|nr:hypothetical protein PR202_gb20719 [Eleusine coracana subsp. coracana]
MAPARGVCAMAMPSADRIVASASKRAHQSRTAFSSLLPPCAAAASALNKREGQGCGTRLLQLHLHPSQNPSAHASHLAVNPRYQPIPRGAEPPASIRPLRRSAPGLDSDSFRRGTRRPGREHGRRGKEGAGFGRCEAQHRQRVRGARVPQEEEEGRQGQVQRVVVQEEERGGGAAGGAAAEGGLLGARAALTTKSWADVEDDDDDDYFATTAPPRPVWGDSHADEPVKDEDDVEDAVRAALQEDVESDEEDLDDEVDDGAEDKHEHEAEDVSAEPAVKPVAAPPAPPKDTERQLSKKELKKKELAELDAVLAELGLSGNSSNAAQDGKNENATVYYAEKKGANQTVDGEKKDDAPAPSESKSSKKKKNKKDKSSKEAKETQEAADGTEENASAEPDEDTASVDVKERLKKMASMKKKKSSKETDTAAKIAAAEAAARSARLAAAKKKEKSHYNQQPVR